MTDYYVEFVGEQKILIRDTEQRYRKLMPEDAVYYAFQKLKISDRLSEEQFIKVSVNASIKPRKVHEFIMSAYDGGTGSYTLDEFDDFYYPDLASWKKYQKRRFESERDDLEEFKKLIDAINKVEEVTK